jgi:solute carrier family 24 (sodium/potassium/calcium exchanger), member 6
MATPVPVDPKTLCTYTNIFGPDSIYKDKPADQCKVFARGTCAKEEHLVNFYALHFCFLNASSFGMICFCLIFITFNFRWIGIVVEEYLAEGITRISAWFGFSEALAAVTLLAFANGAGDIFTAMVASGSSDGVFYSIGSLYGAGLFCCCNVVGCAIFLNESPVMKFDSSIIYRDISFYIAATIAIIIFGFIGKVNIWVAVVFMSLYICQVGSILYQQCKGSSKPFFLFFQ